jgi:LemA protein
MTPLIVIGILVVALIAYSVYVYNSLQQLKTQIAASIQEIGNQLKRQASLIPNLQTSVQAFMKQEKGVFEMLTQARMSANRAADSGSASQLEQAITDMQSVLPRINVLIEDNPELKSNETVQQFMRELTDTSDKLMYARRSLIDLSQRYNAQLIMFPSSLVASVFGFKPEKGLETPTVGAHGSVSEAETQDVNIKL